VPGASPVVRVVSVPAMPAPGSSGVARSSALTPPSRGGGRRVGRQGWLLDALDGVLTDHPALVHAELDQRVTRSERIRPGDRLPARARDRRRLTGRRPGGAPPRARAAAASPTSHRTAASTDPPPVPAALRVANPSPRSRRKTVGVQLVGSRCVGGDDRMGRGDRCGSRRRLRLWALLARARAGKAKLSRRDTCWV
jgi:hypothetical protein